MEDAINSFEKVQTPLLSTRNGLGQNKNFKATGHFYHLSGNVCVFVTEIWVDGF